jgi:hypothetical protein
MALALELEAGSTEPEVVAALERVGAALPSLSVPTVETFQLELGVDSNGREAAFITAVLEDAPAGQTYSWPSLKPIHDLIWKEFTDHGITRWPYVEFRLRSEVGADPDAEQETGEAGT